MGWWRWSGGPWPGHGPFSYLPPWERPGWALWWGARPWVPYYPSYAAAPYYDAESERRYLESYKLYLEDLKARLEDEIKRVDERLSKLRS